MTQWVRQEEPNGCVPACLAMVLGLTYRELCDRLLPEMWRHRYENGEMAWYRGGTFADDGLDIEHGYHWLEEHGFASQKRYAVRWGHERRPLWPPTPFAPIHMALTVTPIGKAHAVVVAKDGTILDPNRAPGTWSGTWDFYKDVYHVCGLWKVAE